MYLVKSQGKMKKILEKSGKSQGTPVRGKKLGTLEGVPLSWSWPGGTCPRASLGYPPNPQLGPGKGYPSP